MTETHLAVATSSSGIPQTKTSNPIPGRFPYSTYHDPPVQTYTYTIPMEWSADALLFIAAQADVQKLLYRDLTGDWVLRFVFGGNWDHDMEVTIQYQDGSFMGSGGYPAEGPPYTHPWTVEGSVSGNDVEFTIVYIDPAPNPGYTVWVTGTIAADGTMSGTWSSNIGQSGTWMSLTGNALAVFQRETAWGDGAGFPGANWATYFQYTVQWVLVETIHVPATSSTPTYSTTLLESGKEYKIVASGTAYAGGKYATDIEFDAEYSYTWSDHPTDWVNGVAHYENYGPNLLDLKVEGQFIDWGPFNSDHVYEYIMTGTGSTLALELVIYDIYYPNNSGALTVDIYVSP